jgi:hypothetical protein
MSTKNDNLTLPSWRHLNTKIVDTNLHPYLVRIAVLAYRTQPRFSSSNGTTSPESHTPRRGHSRRNSVQDLLSYTNSSASENLSSAHNISFGNNKLPKEVPKLLQAKFKTMALKPDGKTNDDPLLRRSFLSFYALLLSPDFVRQIKDNRRAEDLVMRFLSCVSKELNKSAIPPQESKGIVDKQASAFVRLLIDTIRDGGLAKDCPGLIKQLESYEKSLKSSSKISLQPSISSSNVGDGRVLQTPTFQLEDMTLAKDVSSLMVLSSKEIQRDIDDVKNEATEKIAVADLKAVEHSFSDYNQHTVYQKIDFESSEEWEIWKAKELEAISQVISHYSRKHSSISATTQPEYYYIPPDPKSYYRHLLKRCLERDFRTAGRELESNPDSAPLLVSKSSINLLNEVANLWRIPAVTRSVLLLDVAQEMFSEELFDLNNLNDAFNLARHVATDQGKKDWMPNEWPKADRVHFVTCLMGAHDMIINKIEELLTHIYENSPPKIGPYLETLDMFIYSDAHMHGFSTVEPSQKQIERLEAAVVRASEAKYDSLIDDIPRDHTLDPLHIIDLADKITGISRKLHKRYKFPLLDKIDIASISEKRHFMLFSADSQSMFSYMMSHMQARNEEPSFEDMIVLYRKLAEIRDRFHEISSDKFAFDIEGTFYPYVVKWAESSASLSQSWVDPAIDGDNFSPVNSENDMLYSSSVNDVFSSFRSALHVLDDLGWRNEFHKAKILTTLMKGISGGTCQYALRLMNLFLEELKSDQEHQPTQIRSRQEKWIAMAKNAVNGRVKAPPPYQFLTETCVKLNNIERAQVELDKVETEMNSEKQSQIISKIERTHKKKAVSFLFTVKVMQAEGLKACDMNGLSDPYVTLVDRDNRKTIGKTRTIYEDLNPYWDEMFEIVTTGPKWLTATVWDENALSNHDLCGRAYIRLDPNAFQDFVSQVSYILLSCNGGIY